MIIRHGEKPEDGVPGEGLDPQGNNDPASLTAEGWARAKKLVGFFIDHDAEGIRTPTRIFACKPDSDSKRPMETVTPLANQLWPKPAELSANFDLSHDRDDFDGLVSAVVATDGVVLICWEHKRIPDIAARIKHTPASPERWPGHRFDIVFVFDGPAPNYAFSQTPQNLMPGDKDKPI
jgi:broad specificity phosphatase PhoE